MPKWLVPGCAVLLLGVAALVWRSSEAEATLPEPPATALAAPPLVAPEAGVAPELHAPAAPEPTPKSREEKRFARYDKDHDAGVSREEFLSSQAKRFGKLDRNGDGRLAFEEYATARVEKFEAADADQSGVLTPDEFAITAAKRGTARKPARAADCPTRGDQDEAES